jgi:hypothetical protein
MCEQLPVAFNRSDSIEPSRLHVTETIKHTAHRTAVIAGSRKFLLNFILLNIVVPPIWG